MGKANKNMNRAVMEIKRSRNDKAKRMLQNIYTTGYTDGYQEAMETFRAALRTTYGVGEKTTERVEKNILENYNNNPIANIIGEEKEI